MSLRVPIPASLSPGRSWCLGLLAVVAACGRTSEEGIPEQAPHNPEASLLHAPASVQIGALNAGRAYDIALTLTNTGSRLPLKVTSVESSCDCTRLSQDGLPVELRPGESRTIRVRLSFATDSRTSTLRWRSQTSLGAEMGATTELHYVASAPLTAHSFEAREDLASGMTRASFCVTATAIQAPVVGDFSIVAPTDLPVHVELLDRQTIKIETLLQPGAAEDLLVQWAGLRLRVPITTDELSAWRVSPDQWRPATDGSARSQRFHFEGLPQNARPTVAFEALHPDHPQHAIAWSWDAEHLVVTWRDPAVPLIGDLVVAWAGSEQRIPVTGTVLHGF